MSSTHASSLISHNFTFISSYGGSLLMGDARRTRHRGQAGIMALLLCIGCVSAGWAPSAYAQRGERDRSTVPSKSSAKFLAAFREVVAQPSLSTVRVRCEGKDVALGTVVAADGWVLTKASELHGKLTCKLHDGREMAAHLVGVQEDYDLAMLKIDTTGLTPVRWQDSSGTGVGSWLASPGLGEEPVAVGVLSVAARKIGGRERASRNNGSGFLGIVVEPGSNNVTITEVAPESAAARAGLKANDHILFLAGQRIKDSDALFSTMQKTRPGEVVLLRVLRDAKELELTATLDKRPPLVRQDFQNQLGSELSNRRNGFPVILQHDTVLRPTDCGGPVVDLDGKTVGINIARAGRTETYAIPTEAVLPLLNDLKSGKLAPPPPRPSAAVLRATEKAVAARAALKKAQAEQEGTDKKVNEARAALRKAEGEKNPSKTKINEAKTALQKAETDQKAVMKKVREAQTLMEKAEAEAGAARKAEAK
jgi:serine protease Do